MGDGRSSWIDGARGGTELALLRGALRDSNSRIRTQAMRAIGYMGPEAAEAAPDLVRMMAEETNVAEAVDALREIGEAAVPLIMELVEGGGRLSEAALEAIRAIGKPEAGAR